METFVSWTIKIILVALTVFFTIYGEQLLWDKSEGKKAMNLVEFFNFWAKNGRAMLQDIAIPFLAVAIIVIGFVIVELIFAF